jgi:hypothetical protein
MTDQEPMMRCQRTAVIGGERATTEKKPKTTKHDAEEQRSTKQWGPSLTKHVGKKSESERQQQNTEIRVNRFTFSSKQTCDTLSNFL